MNLLVSVIGIIFVLLILLLAVMVDYFSKNLDVFFLLFGCISAVGIFMYLISPQGGKFIENMKKAKLTRREERILARENRKELKIRKEIQKTEYIEYLKRKKTEYLYNLDSIIEKINENEKNLEELNNIKRVSTIVDTKNFEKLNEVNNKLDLLTKYFAEYYQKYYCLFIKAILDSELQLLQGKIYDTSLDIIKFKNDILNKLNLNVEICNRTLKRYKLKNTGLIEREIIEAVKKIDDFVVAYLRTRTNKLIKQTSPITENELIKKLEIITSEYANTEDEFNTLNNEYERICAELEIVRT